MAKGKERAVMYRAVRFEVVPTSTQLALLMQISAVLRTVWNEALVPRLEAFARWVEARKEEKGSEKRIKIPTLFDQINLLTARREGDATFAGIPRNWQEETLDRLNGSFQSFFQLRKNNDPHARTPRERGERFFQVIPGRSGFAVTEGVVHFAPQVFGKGVLAFPVPEYCRAKLADGKVKKFTLSRDEHDLRKPGRFWVSIVYEIPAPTVAPVGTGEEVYLSLGASSLGVLSKEGAHTVKLWRPDKHWKPKIEALETRLKNEKITKGSRKWTGLMDARRRMFELERIQQRQNHREVVKELLQYGKHFVVTDYTVRSKPGKLADRKVEERGGPQGLNWAAQNTGSFLHLLMHLEEKVKEVGGSVTRHKLTEAPPRGIGQGHENKVAMAKFLKEDYYACAEV
jgi:putative transposase